MLNKTKLFWINQQNPNGFGDAVMYAESFVGNDDFLVIAGDTLIPKGDKVIKKLMNTDEYVRLKKCLTVEFFNLTYIIKYLNN